MVRKGKADIDIGVIEQELSADVEAAKMKEN